MKGIRSTKKCVKCLKREATSWCGYVIDKDKTILAGWCRYCSRSAGFSGHFEKQMGVVKENFL